MGLYDKEIARNPFKELEGEWSPSRLSNEVTEFNNFRKLISEGNYTEAVTKYISAKTAEKDGEALNRDLKGYDNAVAKAMQDYVFNNIGSVVDYLGKGRLLETALRMPVFGKAPEGVKGLESLLTDLEKEGPEAVAKKELEGLSDSMKFLITSTRSPEDIAEEAKRFATAEAVRAIDKYGIANYLSDAVKISDSAEQEYSTREREIQIEKNKALEELQAKNLAPTGIQSTEVARPYEEKLAELRKKYEGKIGGRSLLFGSAQEGDPVPMLARTIQAKYQAEQEAAEQAKKAAEKKGDKK